MCELRKKVIERLEAEEVPTLIACNFGMGRSASYSIKKLYKGPGQFFK